MFMLAATPFISGLEGGPGVYGFSNNEQVSEFLLDTAPVRAVALLDVRDGSSLVRDSTTCVYNQPH